MDKIVCGSTHIDLAWKRDKKEMAELFEIAIGRLLDILDTDDEFTYVIEQTSHFRVLALERPDLFQRVVKYVQAGRLEFVGGMCSTAETNGPGGESLVRNMLLGRNWVKKMFDIDIETGWLVDTFGLNAQIPQILKQFGINNLMATRFGGTKYKDVFIAEGIDGSEILVVGRDVYAPYVKPEHLYFSFVQQWRDIEKLCDQACSFATGDGPYLIMPYTENETVPSTRVMAILRESDVCCKNEGWRYGLPKDFFNALRCIKKEWPRENGDLNPEFTGTNANRIGLRTKHRRVENLLLEAEQLNTLLNINPEHVAIQEAWWTLFFVQFHDVFTGSHPTKIYKSVLEELESVQALSYILIDKACRQIMTHNIVKKNQKKRETLCVINSLPWDREDRISVPKSELQNGHYRISRRGVPVVSWSDESNIYFMASVPSAGYAIFDIEEGMQDLPQEKRVEDSSLENDFLRLSVSVENGISLYWKPSDQYIFKNIKDILTIQQDHGNFQIEEPHGTEVGCDSGEISLTCISYKSGVVGLSLSGAFPELSWLGSEKPLSWQINFELSQGKPRIDMTVKLRWKGEASRIRLKLATDIDSSRAIYEIPFGTILRRPYRDRGTAKGEWPTQRFVALQEREKGLALLNTGVHGVEVMGGTLWTTLLRAPATEYAGMFPDDTSSQHGEHCYTFALVPYSGSLKKSEVIRECQAINRPLSVRAITIDGDFQQDEFSWLKLSCGTTVLSAVKYAEDDSNDVIIRLYEALGENTRTEFTLKGMRKVWQSDVCETKKNEIHLEDQTIEVTFKPFEIKTLRIMREL